MNVDAFFGTSSSLLYAQTTPIFMFLTGASTFAKRGPNWLRRSNEIIFAIDLSLLRVIQFRQTLASLVFSLRHRRCFYITICYLDAASRARRKMRLVKIRG